jgi:hypothetical protein
MVDAVIDGNAVYQCPTCAYVEEKPKTPAVEEVPEESGAA